MPVMNIQANCERYRLLRGGQAEQRYERSESRTIMPVMNIQANCERYRLLRGGQAEQMNCPPKSGQLTRK